ncbi:glycine--tRNA ligase [Candidatus Woesearchaeota archaeon]|nr:glycine--tRNA ligase [Candidatus Woesearchaeota archaeon]
MVSIDEMAVFCKKKGIVFLNSDIYGGISGFWDFGPLGVELKNNIKKELWKRFVQQRADVVGIDGATITNKKVWEASGHVSSFSDILMECKKCKKKHRGDTLVEDTTGKNVDGSTKDEILSLIKKHKIKCPDCGSELKTGKSFNLMFSTNVGAVEDDANKTYLRPETAQVIFTNFKSVQETSRLKLPFGIAQIGKAYRNEISPRDFLFRSREFEQFEIEYFTDPEKTKCVFLKEVKNMKVNILNSKDKFSVETIDGLIKNNTFKNEWHAYWNAIFYKWFLDFGIKKENIRLREHTKKELAHYASACFDIEYKFPFGWKEIHGNADRGTFDLDQHIKYSKKELTYFDEETKRKIVPYVSSEPSQGIERALLAFLFDAYNDDKKRGNVMLKLHPKLAPIKGAIFPLVRNKKALVNLAKEVYDELKMMFNCVYDSGGSIGRRYARADEMGIPYCITIDFDSIKKKDVTIRDRDTTKQVRVKIKHLKSNLEKFI